VPSMTHCVTAVITELTHCVVFGGGGIMDRHGYLCGTDRIITRWLKRHLTRLGAGIHLNQLDSLVEDKDMLAENLAPVSMDRHST